MTKTYLLLLTGIIAAPLAATNYACVEQKEVNLPAIIANEYRIAPTMSYLNFKDDGISYDTFLAGLLFNFRNPSGVNVTAHFMTNFASPIYYEGGLEINYEALSVNNLVIYPFISNTGFGVELVDAYTRGFPDNVFFRTYQKAALGIGSRTTVLNGLHLEIKAAATKDYCNSYLRFEKDTRAYLGVGRDIPWGFKTSLGVEWDTSGSGKIGLLGSFEDTIHISRKDVLHTTYRKMSANLAYSFVF